MKGCDELKKEGRSSHGSITSPVSDLHKYLLSSNYLASEREWLVGTRAMGRCEDLTGVYLYFLHSAFRQFPNFHKNLCLSFVEFQLSQIFTELVLSFGEFQAKFHFIESRRHIL
jgi:hypothetical protein